MITTEAKIANSEASLALEALAKLFCHITHCLFVDLYIHKLSVRDVKTAYQKKFNISSRHFNSLRYDLDGKIKAQIELLDINIKGKQAQLKATNAKIKKLEKEKENINSLLKALQRYKQATAQWRQEGRVKKKPKLPKSIQRQKKKHYSLRDLAMEVRKLRFVIHRKKRRREVLLKKLDKLKSRVGRPSLCFGSRKLFRRQFNLAANGYLDHEAWLEDWIFARSNQSFFLGSSDECKSNQNCQYDPLKKTLQIRLPLALEKDFGPYLKLENIDFYYRGDELAKALVNEGTRINKKGKAVKNVKPVSYRFLMRKEREEKYCYCQASFEEEDAEVASIEGKGAIGIDLNADHIAICEVDRFGNPINGGSLPFAADGMSCEQIEAVLGDHIAVIVAIAKESRKVLVCENLDFSKKKAGLREAGGRNYRRMLSSFAYNKFFQMLLSRASREGVFLKQVNPAYTSIIGYLKFRGYESYTPHELAALTIARRGLGFSERVRTKNALSGTASIQGLDDASCFFKESRIRHVWSYYARHKAKIRRHMCLSSKGNWGRLIFNPRHPTGLRATRKEDPSIPPFRGRMQV